MKLQLHRKWTESFSASPISKVHLRKVKVIHTSLDQNEKPGGERSDPCQKTKMLYIIGVGYTWKTGPVPLSLLKAEISTTFQEPKTWDKSLPSILQRCYPRLIRKKTRIWKPSWLAILQMNTVLKKKKLHCFIDLQIQFSPLLYCKENKWSSEKLN